MTNTREHSALLRTVEENLSLLKEEFLASKAQGKPLKLSVQSFAKRFNISRSIIYAKYPDIVEVIQGAFSQWRKASGTDRATVASLQAELRAVKAQANQDLATLANMTLVDFVEKLGPSFRDAIVVQREHTAYKEKIKELEQTIANQILIIEGLRLRISATTLPTDQQAGP